MPCLFYSVRRLVSSKKRRCSLPPLGIDLDLAYVTDDLIAMGYPATGTEAIYRNPRRDVVKFLEHKHADKYKVYNLCSEPNRKYDKAVFLNRTAVYPFDDHNVPTLQQMHDFCKDVAALKETGGVAAVHCKAGKGRTGVMICARLIHEGVVHDAKEAMDFYGKRRTHDGKGVTIPSQRRYVGYFAQMLKDGGVPLQPRKRVSRIRVLGLKEQLLRSLIVVVSMRDPTTLQTTEVARFSLKSGAHEAVPHIVKVEDNGWTCEVKAQMGVGSALAVQGDVRFDVYYSNVHKKNRLFHAWFNTHFMPADGAPVRLDGREQLDKLRKELRKLPVALEVEVDPNPDEVVIKEDDGRIAPAAAAAPEAASAEETRADSNGLTRVPSALKSKSENTHASGGKVSFGNSEEGKARAKEKTSLRKVQLAARAAQEGAKASNGNISRSQAVDYEIALEERSIELGELREEKDNVAVELKTAKELLDIARSEINDLRVSQRELKHSLHEEVISLREENRRLRVEMAAAVASSPPPASPAEREKSASNAVLEQLQESIDRVDRAMSELQGSIS
ncbi:phosphatidylinositol 3,4,5-trisphosphate 3-phosphatase [Pseudoscourfieldia marina]